MKIFVFTVVVLAVAHAAPVDEVKESPRDKRGIFGEPGGLLTPHVHHDSLLGSHLHAPLLSSSGLHHHDLHDHALLHDLHHHSLHHAPVLTSRVHAPLLTSHVHAPVLHDFHHDLHHHDFHHHDLHASPLLLSHHAPVVRVVRPAPVRHIIRSGW